MSKVIRVRPAPQHRRELARWARKHHRGVRTVSSTELGFPPAVFAAIPERLLRGAMVDSRAYVPSETSDRPATTARGAAARAAVGTPATTDLPAAAGVEVPPAETVSEPPPAEPADPQVVGAQCAAPAQASVPWVEAGPGEALPPLPESAYPPDATALDATPAADPQPAAAGQCPYICVGPYGENMCDRDDAQQPCGTCPELHEIAADDPPADDDRPPEPAAVPPSPAEDPGAEPAAPAAAAPEPTPAAPGQPRRGRRAAGAGKYTCPEPGCKFRTGSHHGLKIHTGRAHGGGESA